MADIGDPTCPVCRRPVAPGSLVVYRHCEVVHVRCASGFFESRLTRQAELAAELLEQRTQFPVCAACHEHIRGDYVRQQDGQPVHVTCPPANAIGLPGLSWADGVPRSSTPG
jgi:hypothetical protein